MRCPIGAVFTVIACAFPMSAEAQEGEGAQAKPTIEAALGKVLTQAKASGALERVLGERWFSDPKGGRVRVRCKLEEARLSCEVAFLAVPGAMRQETLTLLSVLGTDGRVLESGFSLVRGRDVVEAQGPASNGTLALKVVESRGTNTLEREVKIELGTDCVPFGFALFVFPLLTDQGLPASLRFRVLHPVNLAIQEVPAELQSKGGQVSIKDFVPGQPPTTIRCAKNAIVSVDLAGLQLKAAQPVEPGKWKELPRK